MSHISLLENEENVFKTPHPRERGQRVKDFAKYSEGPKSFLPCTTPVARRIFHATDLVAEIEEEENIDAIADFQSFMWKTYTVSPLFGYDSDISPDKVTECLKKNLEKHEVTVETVKGLRGTREDEDCLKILTKKETNICSVFFTAVHSQECNIKSKHGLLPLAMANGTEEMIQNIFVIIERMFDCVINPLRFEPIDLQWMTALWAEQTVGDEKKDATFKLRYNLSGFKSPAIQNIDVKFDGEQIRTIWRKIKGNTDTELTMDEMEEFHNVLYKYLYETYGINFEKCTLTNICLPSLSAASTGYIKVHRVDKIKTVLGFLTSLSQEKFITMANPGLGIPLNVM